MSTPDQVIAEPLRGIAGFGPEVIAALLGEIEDLTRFDDRDVNLHETPRGLRCESALRHNGGDAGRVVPFTLVLSRT